MIAPRSQCVLARSWARRISEIAATEQLDPVDVALEVYCLGGGTVVNFAMCEFADVLVFDTQEFRDKSTFEKPGVYAAGVRHLFISGKPANENGNPTPTLCGRVLRHRSP